MHQWQGHYLNYCKKQIKKYLIGSLDMHLVLLLVEGRTAALAEVGLVAVTFEGIHLSIGAIQIIMVEEEAAADTALQLAMAEAMALG
jgi:hypothetical protein